MAATAKVIELKGDPKSPESAEHIIIFPGGSISVCRTSEGKYWAHIFVNKDEKIGESVVFSKKAEIETIRIDTPDGVKTLEVDTNHFAVLIATHSE